MYIYFKNMVCIYDTHIYIYDIYVYIYVRSIYSVYDMYMIYMNLCMMHNIILYIYIYVISHRNIPQGPVPCN